MINPVILANGGFPVHVVPRTVLQQAAPLICCDGAVNKLVKTSREPEIIIGDLDSIAPECRYRFSHIMIEDRDQETNDLTKAVNWCRDRGFASVTILGATGERDDHSIANVSLLADYNDFIQAQMITDTGTFQVFHQTCVISSFAGQQVSIFSFSPETAIESEGLKYPLAGRCLKALWQGSLNEAEGDSFRLTFASGCIMIYSTHP